MVTSKTLAVAAALVVGASSLAFAQNGPATGSEPPVAGGAGGGGAPSAGAPSAHGKSAPSHTMMKHKKKESPSSS
jgi:hypothetical protein